MIITMPKFKSATHATGLASARLTNSDQCAGCHDSNGINVIQNMIFSVINYARGLH